ncbi:butyrophilin subfamily 1 member A1-like [Centrocercus urophasianus]|uniref:butyrophilin subfamily 1 member A1-like n=1 Tax=Centrocercus urophasianus TaxID=9002 RepID=UPI001C653A1C|nr:butyrophilin subfamily 1 member A1-like [Centrocercus urophasianus]XP_042667180.1 butyrophilin subfamily 1 member A1-like [Centrocercus urophasianus]
MTVWEVLSRVRPRNMREVLFLSIPTCFLTAVWLTGESITITADPSVALVGEQVTLSCQLTPRILSNASVLWYKEEKERDAPLCSSSSLDGEVEQCQHEEQCRIKGRWERRRFLLTIQKAQIADSGVYICVVSGNAVSQKAVTHLDIIAIGNKPALVKDQQEESLCRYTCNSKGWYPKPQVIWTTYGGGKKHMEIKTSVTWSETELFVVQSIMAVPCDDVDVKCVIMLIKEKINQTGEHLSSLTKTSILEEKYNIFAIESSDEIHGGHLAPSDLTTNGESYLHIVQQSGNHDWLWILYLFCFITAIEELHAQRRAGEDAQKETLKKIEQLLAQRKAEEDAEKETLKKENELLRAQRHKVDVTLDADTAHPRLQVSEDGKSVTDTGVIRRVPSKEERFDSHTFLLAKEGYTSGRHYWEVDVGKKLNWNLGVAQETVTRKETVALSPENGFWVIGLADGQEYWAHSDPWTRLTVSGRPQKIGIFLDISSKKLSFFNVHQKKMMYVFSFVNYHSQNVKLFPFFSTGSSATNSDTEPLRIAWGFDDDDK